MEFIEYFFAVMATAEPFAEYLPGAMMKTFTLFIGELNYDDFVQTFGVNLTNIREDDPNRSFWSNHDGKASREALKMKLALGQLIFIVFVFLFVIVVLNLLNGIAISDIQVIY